MEPVKINVGLAAMIGDRINLDSLDVFQIARLLERDCRADAEAVFGRDAVRDVVAELTVGPDGRRGSAR